ncbi:MAG: replication initiation protein [Flavobacteriaceae bacterium]|nr:replication initiation protein [Flavobacteriaceae bacterium]
MDNVGDNKTDKSKEIIVREANELVEANYKFDIWEDRIFLMTLAQIRPSDEDFKEYKIYIRDLVTKYGINTNNVYNLVRNAVESLRKKKITIPQRFGEDMGLLTTGLLAAYGEVSKEEASYVVVELHPKLKPYLLQLKERFTQYNISFLMKMQSSHSKRIYKLLKQYEKIGFRRFGIKQLRKILCIENGEYERYYDFKRRFIYKAQKDLEKYTDLIFSFEEKKKGRRVVEIVFYISPNPNKPEFQNMAEEEFLALKSVSPKIAEEATGLYAEVETWGVTKDTFVKYFEARGIKHVETCIEITKSSKNTKDKAAYFVALLKKEEVLNSKKSGQSSIDAERLKQQKIKALEQEYKTAVEELKAKKYNEEQALIIEMLSEESFIGELNAQLQVIGKWPNDYNESLSFMENYQQNRFFKIKIANIIIETYPDLFTSVNAKHDYKMSRLRSKYQEALNT